MIYFIQEGQDGPIKIGYSRDPEKRLKALQTSSSNPLKLLLSLPGTREAEAKLQDVFIESKLEGEWFAPTDELKAFIENPIGELLANQGNREDEEINLRNRWAFKRYKNARRAIEAQKAINDFHEVRRTFLECIIFWLKHRKYLAWKQIIDKRTFEESGGGFVFSFSILAGIVGVKANANGSETWRLPRGIHLQYYYKDDVWQFFPWLIQMDNAGELLARLKHMQCACGGDLESHNYKCDFYDDPGFYSEGFIHLKNGPAEIKIRIDPELMYGSEEVIQLDDDIMA